METNGTTQEPFMRLNFSQNTKGMYFAEKIKTFMEVF